MYDVCRQRCSQFKLTAECIYKNTESGMHINDAKSYLKKQKN